MRTLYGTLTWNAGRLYGMDYMVTGSFVPEIRRICMGFLICRILCPRTPIIPLLASNVFA